MIIGIGTDILRKDQIVPEHLEKDDPFLKKIYTKKERAEAEKRNDKYGYYCTRFAAKEAVFKALGISGEDVSLKEIEVLSKKTGQPYVVLYGNLYNIAKKKNIKQVLVSLSSDKDYYQAFSIAESV